MKESKWEHNAIKFDKKTNIEIAYLTKHNSHEVGKIFFPSMYCIKRKKNKHKIVEIQFLLLKRDNYYSICKMNKTKQQQQKLVPK